LQLGSVCETADDGHLGEGGALGAGAEGAGCAGEGAGAEEGGHCCLEGGLEGG
jgi:hypothetical protein